MGQIKVDETQDDMGEIRGDTYDETGLEMVVSYREAVDKNLAHMEESVVF